MCATVADELQVARTAINSLMGLNPFARRVAVSAILKSLSEQALCQLSEKSKRVGMIEQDLAAARMSMKESSNECKDLAGSILSAVQ